MVRGTPNEVRKKLGERIRALRQAKGLNGAQLAQLSGIRYPYLISIENGKSEMRIKELMAIAQSLETTVAQLLEDIC